MAANTDKLRKSKSNFSTTLSGSIDDSVTTIALSSASGLPTDTAITLTIDRVDANGVSTSGTMERVVGVISGNNITTAVRGVEGSAQAHADAAVVECIWDADTWNDSIDAVLVEHDQDGGHDVITATSVNIGGTVTLTGTLDEDNMASDSAVKLATQQSIKAYVDSGAVTMTNKTLTSPVLNTGVSGTAVLDEVTMSSNSATKLATQQSIKAYVDSNSSGAFGTPSELTIAAGAVTVTAKYHVIDTESDAASDDLDTVSGGNVGDLLILQAADAARTVVVKNATGNLNLAGSDFSLTHTADNIVLIRRTAGAWSEISRSDNLA